ncbi:MAG TPA: hypothetical protein VKX45_13910 [Bryobacteraceae bacterium]|nr:hypothetical protein [Bryobacteraceae bacterium]
MVRLKIEDGIGLAVIIREFDEDRLFGTSLEVLDDRPRFAARQTMFGKIDQQGDRCE